MIPGTYNPPSNVGRVNWIGGDTGAITGVVGASFGPAISKRVWVPIHWRAAGGRTLTGMTIGGVAATRYGRAGGDGATYNIEWWATITSAASGDIVPTWSGGGVSACDVGRFWSDTGYTTSNAEATYDAASGTLLSDTIDTYDNGFLLLAHGHATAGLTVTWAGAAKVFDISRTSFAMLPLTPAQTARAVSATLASAAIERRMLSLAVR